MKLDAVSKWLTLLTNFSVIGGLVLVAIQTNFNTKTISLQNDLELNRALAAGVLAYMGDSTLTAYANAVFRPADLTEAQLAGRDPLQTEGAMRQMLKEIRSLDADNAADYPLTTSPAE